MDNEQIPKDVQPAGVHLGNYNQNNQQKTMLQLNLLLPLFQLAQNNRLEMDDEQIPKDVQPAGVRHRNQNQNKQQNNVAT